MKVMECPECKEQVVETDNSVYLNYPSEPYDEVSSPWTLMHFGPMVFAGVGDAPPSGMGHALHQHQPEDSVVA